MEDEGNVYGFPRYIQDPDTKEWVLMNSQDEVMAFYRAKRNELILDYYKPLFNENGIPQVQ